MREVNIFEVGEQVMVKAVVTGVTIEQGEIKYQLKNEITGRNYEHLFINSQLFPVKAEVDV